MEIEEFEKLVAQAVDSLPDNIKNAIRNTAIVIEPGSRHSGLLGLYEGIPENQWGKESSLRLPDKITIFKQSIEAAARNPKEVRELVKMVVWHEIAHYFGFDEDGARELEQKWKQKLDKKYNL